MGPLVVILALRLAFVFQVTHAEVNCTVCKAGKFSEFATYSEIILQRGTMSYCDDFGPENPRGLLIVTCPSYDTSLCWKASDPDGDSYCPTLVPGKCTIPSDPCSGGRHLALSAPLVLAGLTAALVSGL